VIFVSALREIAGDVIGGGFRHVFDRTAVLLTAVERALRTLQTTSM